MIMMVMMTMQCLLAFALGAVATGLYHRSNVRNTAEVAAREIFNGYRHCRRPLKSQERVLWETGLEAM
jgi:hypothetical protein